MWDQTRTWTSNRNTNNVFIVRRNDDDFNNILMNENLYVILPVNSHFCIVMDKTMDTDIPHFLITFQYEPKPKPNKSKIISEIHLWILNIAMVSNFLDLWFRLNFLSTILLALLFRTAIILVFTNFFEMFSKNWIRFNDSVKTGFDIILSNFQVCKWWLIPRNHHSVETHLKLKGIANENSFFPPTIRGIVEWNWDFYSMTMKIQNGFEFFISIKRML